jgi:ADP-ribose pyrophosphatase YjhB (NUDIX family)
MPGQSYEESYLGQLRKLIGKERVIINTARAVIFDEYGSLLLIRRWDNDSWAMSAGAMELGESIWDCMVREVCEESGLKVKAAELFVIWSDPAQTSIVTEYGDPYQLVVFVFRVQSWSGQLVRETDETIDAGFFHVAALPEIAAHTRQTLEDLKTFNENEVLILR